MTSRLAETLRLAALAEGPASWDQKHTRFLNALRKPTTDSQPLPRLASRLTHPQLRHPMFVGFHGDTGKIAISDTTTCSCLTSSGPILPEMGIPAGICAHAGGLAVADYTSHRVHFMSGVSKQSIKLPLAPSLHPSTLASGEDTLVILSANDDLNSFALHAIGTDGVVTELPAPAVHRPRGTAILGSTLLITCDNSPTIYAYSLETHATTAWATDSNLIPYAAITAHENRVFALRGNLVEALDAYGNRQVLWDAASMAQCHGAHPISIAYQAGTLLVGDTLNQCVHELVFD